MQRKRLIICDEEEGYGKALASFLGGRKELSFQIQLCEELSGIREIRQQAGIDLLIISSFFEKEKREEFSELVVCVLQETGREELLPHEEGVFRYQPGERIWEAILHCCEERKVGDALFLPAAGKRSIRILGVFSPVGRTGKTEYALELGKRLSRDRSTLYINMEVYGGRDGRFSQGRNTGDALYYIRQEKGNLGRFLSTMAGHLEDLDYLGPVSVSEDIKNVPKETWQLLLSQIEKDSLYEAVVLDIDPGLTQVYELLRLCTEIHVPVGEEGAEKLAQMDWELKKLGYEDIQDKMIRKRGTDVQSRAAICKDPGRTGYDERSGRRGADRPDLPGAAGGVRAGAFDFAAENRSGQRII